MDYFDFLESLESIAVRKELRLCVTRAPIGCGFHFYFKKFPDNGTHSAYITFQKQHSNPDDLFERLEKVADEFNKNA